MREKQHTAYRQQQDIRRRAYLDTRILREDFPRVAQLVLHMTFIDPRGVGRHSAQTHSFSPAAKAYFAVACPWSLCLDGGFDLGPVIAEMLSTGCEEAVGTLQCHGWQSSGRGDNDRCLLELRYRLSACYKTEGVSARVLDE